MKNYFKSAGKFVETMLFMGCLNLCTSSCTDFSRVNEEYYQREFKQLAELETKVLEKASKNDGEIGLSFADKANLAKRFGYKGVFQEGQQFRLFFNPAYSSGLTMYVNQDEFTIPKIEALKYLE